MVDDQMHTSAELEQRAMEMLTDDEYIEAGNIQVHVTRGTALVTGTVPSDVMRILVTRDVEAIPGIIGVDNQLEVGTYTPDTQYEDMAAKIRQMIADHKDIDESHIRISVIEEGFIILEGHVNTDREKELIEDITDSFLGTIDIENRIAVIPGNRAEDANIARSIIENILETGEVSIDTINIKVKHGKVTVTGSVPTWMIYNALYRIIEVTEGVTQISLNVEIGTTIG